MFKKSKNKGFSLVELIVVIAILVVFATILVPSLLQYTENSRAQKDVSAMDEVVNAVQLALADEKCFDEALKYSCTNNYLTYSDSSGNYGQQINDSEFWAPDGSGRATTITFNPEYGPNNQIIYDLSKGLVNDMTYGNGSVAADRTMEGALVADNQCYLSKLPQIYNTVRQTVGNDVITTSQTYRNSSFTVFIKFNQKDGATVADVNGSFNGTNLYDGADASKGSGTSSYDSNGDAITSVTTPGTTKSEYTSSDLNGTGSHNGSITITNKIEDYKQPTYIENLQKENEFEYYSSLYAAVQDVNNGTRGKNADVHKEDAVAGIFVDEQGNISVVLLKDTTETAHRIETYKNMTIVLGGNTLLLDGVNGFSSQSGTLIVDGRINGSTIKNVSSNNKLRCVSVQEGGKAIIYGGSYISEQPQNGVDYNAMSTKVVGPIWSRGEIDIYDANIVAKSNDDCAAYGVDLQKTSYDYKIENCTISVYSKGRLTSSGEKLTLGISANAKSLMVKNTIFHIETLNTKSGAVFLMNGTPGKFVNCDITVLTPDCSTIAWYYTTGYENTVFDKENVIFKNGYAFQ